MSEKIDDLDTRNIDAMHWALQFCKTMTEQNWSLDEIDESLMIGWFANYRFAVSDPLTARIEALENPWISVDERLPDDRCQVLCYGENGYCTRIYSEGDWFNENGASTMNVMGDVEDIEYWAFLPRNPTTGDK